VTGEGASADAAAGPLWLKRFDDVILTRAQEAREIPTGFRSAGYTSSGELIREFAFRREMHEAPPAPFEAAATRIRVPHLYGGVFLRHYGHFLLESLSRFWAMKAYPDLPVVWQFFKEQKRPDPWQAEVLDIVGIKPDRILLVRQPTRFATLIAADEGVRINTFFHPAQVEALASYQFRAPQTSKRVWLSRRKLKVGAGRVLDEEAIEERLAGLGWRVVNPETLSVREQLDAMADAGTLGGFVGSAYHTLILGRDVQAKVRMVRRYNGPIPESYDRIAALKGLDQRIVNTRLDALNETDNSSLSVSRLADRTELDRVIEELND
jgi:capsular polysaccharide biosynthesis protein